MNKPPVVSETAWRDQRLELLAAEKELTQHKDRVNAQRRRLPMTRVEKEYFFDAPEGQRTLEELFEGQKQLIVYHFMFDPAWDEGCGGCTGFVNALGDLSMLGERDTTFVLVSRGPLAKLEGYAAKQGWHQKWVSSWGSDFNYDYHVTLDDKVRPVEYNYKTRAELNQTPNDLEGEAHGLSVFFRDEEGIYHTYSSYARGAEGQTDAYALLDLTPYGRQEDFEDSPAGWPQKPTYG